MPLINKLVMQGFKSFAKRTEMPFSNKFNMVIGPNGSGKSNILDALCFVLGKISSKGLRAKEIAKLVYDGRETRQPASKGEVSIFFNNSEKLLPSEEKTVKLSRIIKPSGQSIYKINDKKRTRQEIVDMMAAGKISSKGYNIVLQGDVAKFMDMSSEELRAVIEEVAGIRVYEEKKKKATSELEKVQTKISEAEILLEERKTNLKDLKKDRDLALKYKDLSEKMRDYKATHLHLQSKSRSEKRDDLNKEIEGHKKEIEKLEEQIEKLKQAAEAKKKQIAELTEEAEKKGHSEQIALHKEIDQTKTDLAESNGRIRSINSELKKSKDAKEQLSKDSEERSTEMEELLRLCKEKEKTKSELVKEKTRFEDEIRKLRGSGEEIAKLEQERSELDGQLEKFQTEMQAATERKQKLLRDKDKTEYQISSIEASIRKIAEIEKTNKEELEQLEAKRKDFKKKILELNRFLSDESSTSARIGDAKRLLHQCEQDFAKANSELMQSRERTLGNNAIKAILRQDMIKGIRGTASQIGEVPEKYATALESAAGSRLNSIVVDSDSVAAKCIAYLKQNRLGRATFLPLNKLKPVPKKQIEKEQGIHGLAADFVKFDPQYLNVFRHVFGNTVVVESIATARKIGIGKYRMVTLDGDLTEVSGAMQGGFRQKTSSVFKERRMDQKVQSLKEKIEQARSSLSILEAKRTKDQKTIEELRQEKSILEGEIIKSEKSLHLESSDADVSKKTRQNLNKEIQKIDQELSEIQNQTREMNVEIAKAKSRKFRLTEAASNLSNPAVLAELKSFEEAIETINGQMQETETEISASKTKFELFRQEKEKIQNNSKQITREEEKLKKEKTELEEKKEQFEKKLEKMKVKISKFDAESKALMAKKEKVREALQHDEEKMIRKEEQTLQIEIKINNVTAKASEMEGELSRIKEESSRYADAKIVKNISEEKLRSSISRFERSVSEMGNVNMKSLEIYDDVEAQYNEMLSKKETLSKEREDVLSMMEEIESAKTEVFMRTFETLNDHFKKAYSELSSKGGEGYLMVENPEKPFEAGVRIKVRLAEDKFEDLISLSGGEKTMTALAFIFSIQEYEPSAFYIFDEVDAALDKKNSERFAQLVKKYSQKSQYIVISHNDNVIVEANSLYGVSMDENKISNVISLKE